jgi:hypothetical protein
MTAIVTRVVAESPLALALYLKTKPQRFDARVIAGSIRLTLLANFVHHYIYVMLASIATAAGSQAGIERRAPLGHGLISMALLLLAERR